MNVPPDTAMAPANIATGATAPMTREVLSSRKKEIARQAIPMARGSTATEINIPRTPSSSQVTNVPRGTGTVEATIATNHRTNAPWERYAHLSTSALANSASEYLGKTIKKPE